MTAVLPSFRHPQVRQLAWAIGSTPLLQRDPSWVSATESQAFYADALPLLRSLDQDPALLLQFIAESKSQRRGHYFERLLAFWFTHSPYFDLIAAQHQVFENERTVGEFDFVVLNKRSGQTEHWEVAVKYFLGIAGKQWLSWIGPNPKDSLGKKTQKLEQQAKLGSRAGGQQVLRDLNLSAVTSRVFLKGYLFRHLSMPSSLRPYATPVRFDDRWCTLREFLELPGEHWACLMGNDWIGPFETNQRDQVVSKEMVVAWGASCFEAYDHPVLIALLQPAGSGWRETMRVFLVPDDWPDTARLKQTLE